MINILKNTPTPLFIIGLIFLFSCDPCRNGRACHRNGTKTKKKQAKTSKSNHKNQNISGGFSF